MKKTINAMIILDGFGCNERAEGNAIKAAGTPQIDRFAARYPHTTIQASGMAVGLPAGQMGNSEVGHTNIGAGRIVYQELTRITKSIADGDFFTNEALCWAMDSAKAAGRNLHLVGLVSDGGVHSHSEHLYALVKMARDRGVRQCYIHAMLDGRDVPPTSGLGFIRQLEDELGRLGYGRIATVMGRYWGMDRDHIWERVQRAYDAMVCGEGLQVSGAEQAVAQSYERDQTDEFVQPSVVLGADGAPVGSITAGDSVICFNFRPDRVRQITRTLVDADFTGFTRKTGFLPLQYVCLTQYDKAMPNCRVAYLPQSLQNTLGQVISDRGMTQLRIAETQKYAHVTFFFNAGVEQPYPGEDRCLIPSAKVATFDEKPEMSAYEVTEEALKRIESGQYDVMVLNFANCDMVGHTGIMAAAEAAVKEVDADVGILVDEILRLGGRAFVTADHGNAD